MKVIAIQQSNGGLNQEKRVGTATAKSWTVVMAHRSLECCQQGKVTIILETVEDPEYCKQWNKDLGQKLGL